MESEAPMPFRPVLLSQPGSRSVPVRTNMSHVGVDTDFKSGALQLFCIQMESSGEKAGNACMTWYQAARRLLSTPV